MYNYQESLSNYYKICITKISNNIRKQIEFFYCHSVPQEIVLTKYVLPFLNFTTDNNNFLFLGLILYVFGILNPSSIEQGVEPIRNYAFRVYVINKNKIISSNNTGFCWFLLSSSIVLSVWFFKCKNKTKRFRISKRYLEHPLWPVFSYAYKRPAALISAYNPRRHRLWNAFPVTLGTRAVVRMWLPQTENTVDVMEGHSRERCFCCLRNMFGGGTLDEIK